MATNTRHQGAPNVALPLTVGETVAAGDVIKIGTAGLTGHVLTARATTATITAGTAAPGLTDGQASVELIGVTKVVDLKVESAAGVEVGAAIYVDGNGDYTETAAGNSFIGWALEEIDDEATGKVGLASYTPTIVAGS